MAYIEVVRLWFTDFSTISKVSLRGVYECFSLEDRVRAAGVKVQNKTAIPAGEYDLEIDLSARFNRYLPHILNVPLFSGIRIHSGNVAADTEGCLLLGKERAQDSVLESHVAFEAFFLAISAAAGRDDQGRAIFKLREPTRIHIIDNPVYDTRTELAA